MRSTLTDIAEAQQWRVIVDEPTLGKKITDSTTDIPCTDLLSEWYICNALVFGLDGTYYGISYSEQKRTKAADVPL